ncbi:metallophosphoesterase [Candidatus Poribacteria bacterium]|nr:metallophosphoesterase [Candidatus Poribacteria bacterium]
MVLGLISDTHDRLDKLEQGVALLATRRPDLVVHAGDFISPFTARYFKPVTDAGLPFVGIFGNNDGERFGLRRLYEHVGVIHEDPHAFEFGGRRILLTHKEILVDSLARSGDYDIVLYGHTHRVDVRTEPCLIVNPGEGCGWLTGKATLAFIDLDALKTEIVEF